MNERIKELVKQAGGRFSTHTLTSYPAQRRESVELWDKNIEKFAELIVRECINLCYDRAYRGTLGSFTDGAMLCANEIKEHFGVEE